MLLIVFTLAIIIGISVWLIKCNNQFVIDVNNIKKEKSRVNTVRQKYLKIQNKTLIMAGKAMNNESKAKAQLMNNSRISTDRLLALGQQYPELQSQFDRSAEIIDRLYSEYQSAQEELNETITAFNSKIGQFPKSLAAKILGYKQTRIIGEEHLEEAMKVEFEKDLSGDEYL